ncbi:protein Tob1-like [Pollicipes pollicipes]|uniref:protein Tob1-like n=1 Tax=Pollicipes pollicipes TaxID=41117 RepID=UPI0018851BBD|nr:protein Tob1-like [Pollicipes pollicipes]
MQLEIQVALNFVISFMYNKLPRRRVNIFAEELERALRFKFQSHWYPDRPFKGSAYRCLKTGDPLDPVLDAAARESGLALAEIRQNLPEDLCVWIDPGEVSYRAGEKGAVKLLYSEPAAERVSEDRCDHEVTSTFNPEAQSFRPIEALAASLGSLGVASPPAGSPFGPPAAPRASATPPFRTASPATGFAAHRPRAPVTFTTAAFAQTKFGSTKLKSSGKRGSRMSPTEFSNYIKQRALLQQPPALFAPFAQLLLESLTYASNPHLRHLLVAN